MPSCFTQYIPTPVTSGNTLINAKTGQEIPLAMQHLSLSGQVSPAGAFLRATHLFRCAEGGSPMEAIYIFMLPRNATIRRFIVKGDGFEVESKISPRAEARKEYEDGIQAGHLSTLAEMNVDGMVSLSVGQVQPDEIITVIVDVVAGVDVQDGKYRFRFPFTLAPNYHAQAKMTPTHAGGKIELPSDIFGDLVLPEWKSDPSGAGLHQVSFKIHVEAGGELDSVASPSHRVLVRPGTNGSAEVELAGAGDTPNRDLVLDVTSKVMAPVVFVDERLINQTTGVNDPKIPANAPAWTAVIPSSCVPRAADAPREVCFVVDRSGSMHGHPLDRAKVAMKACLSALKPTDKFGLIHFGNEAIAFDKAMCFATDANRKRAGTWIDAFAATGGTELANALGEAVEVLGAPGKDIFLLTDGEVGDTGPILEQCAACGTRIHAMGIGSAAQDRFLASLARRTGGVDKMVGVSEDVAMAALGMFNAIRQPVQVDVKGTISDSAGTSQDHDVGTVWEDKSLVITDNGKVGFVPDKIHLKWVGGDVIINLPTKRATPNGLSALLWAGRQVEDLEATLDMTRKGPAHKAVEIELRDLSTTYGLASRVMSLCAVVKRPGDKAGEVTQQVVPVGTPESMTMFGGRSICLSMPVASASLGGHSHGVYGMAPTTTSSWGATRSRSVTSSYNSGIRLGDQVCNLVDDCDDNMSLDYGDQESSRGFTKGIRRVTNGIVPRESSATFDVLWDLAKIEADGGLPGATIGERFFKTVFLALNILARDTADGTTVFSAHLARMVKFIETYLTVFPSVPNSESLVRQLVDRITTNQEVKGDWLRFYLNYKGDEAASWNIIESNITR